MISVFCLYKSFVSEDLFDNFDGSRYSSLRRQKNIIHESDQQQQNELSSSYNELNEARQRLRLLEMKIQTLENRIARKYPDVLFLNYKNRKRILVSLMIIIKL